MNETENSDLDPKKPLTKAEKIRSLPWYVAFVTTNSVAIHLTFIGSIFVLYLNELGINKFLIGTILSLLPFLNILSVFIAPKVTKIGIRKVFLVSFTTRYLIWVPIVLATWVREQFGQVAMVLMLVVIVVGFSTFRMINMVALLPWNQEIIPESIRGMFTAKQNIYANIANIVTVTLAGIYIENAKGVSPFNVLFIVGIIFGLISAWTTSHFPGGEPRASQEDDPNILQSIITPLRDQNFRRYIYGMGLIVLAESLFSFVAIYMSEVIGLSTGTIVILQTASLIGGALTSFLWGWAADRFGSKPILHVNMVLIALLPILWFIMPSRSGLSLYVALGIAFLQGAGQMGRVIGGSRLLYNRMVPIKSSASYMAFYNAWIGLVTGISQLFGGVLLGAFSGINGSLLRFQVNEYSIIFSLILAFSILAIIMTGFVKTEGEVSMGKFVGMFLRGNPFLAFETLISFQRARSERETISLTERIGRAQSDLTNEELQASLEDPRFFVRYEAIVSIARHNPHPDLTKSLAKILNGDDPALSVVSAWALGRIDDPTAVDALRYALKSSAYRSVRAHCARSLGSLGDAQSIPALMHLFHNETDRGLMHSYAVALGQLGVAEVFDDVLELMIASNDKQDRMELALTLGRLIGDEDDFIFINRQLRDDFSTNASQIIQSLQVRKFKDIESFQLTSCAAAFAQNDLLVAVQELLRISQALSQPSSNLIPSQLIERLSEHLADATELRKDLITLVIFALFEISENE